MKLAVAVAAVAYVVVAIVVAAMDRRDPDLIAGAGGGEWGTTVLFSAIWPIYLLLRVLDASDPCAQEDQ